MDPGTPAEARDTAAKLVWSDVFTPTDADPRLFAVQPGFAEAVVARANASRLPTVISSVESAVTTLATPVLDGLILEYTTSRADQEFAPGTRVLGWNTLRWLCDAVGADQPARFADEPDPATPEALRAAVARQGAEWPQRRLTDMARLGIRMVGTRQLTRLTGQLTDLGGLDVPLSVWVDTVLGAPWEPDAKRAPAQLRDDADWA